jgi:outer membrane protein, heavy metal efflux system
VPTTLLALARCLIVAALGSAPVSAWAQVRISHAQVRALARERAPALVLARASERVAEADSRVGGLYPNPSVTAGTSTQTARLTLDASIPLVLLGQRGAALKAGRSELAAAKIDTQISAVDARAFAGHSFVALWLAERTAAEREKAATVAARLESAVQGRVELGSAPEQEGLRAHAERLRADIDAQAALAAVDESAALLAAWIGAPVDAALRVSGDPEVPRELPALAALGARLDQNPSVQRAQAEVEASLARASSERAQLRPLMTLGFGAELYDPTLPAPNYRAQLGLELPLFNQRGPLIEREEQRAAVARLRVQTEQVQLSAALLVAYRSFRALSQQSETLASGVVPAAVAAARATEESYALGRAPLHSVLDAERARIEAELSLLQTQGARADAWINVEQALGVR